MSRNETDDTSPERPQRQRIAKLMARVGLCSRREAEAWILAGRVSVNGTVLTGPATDVAPEDRITVDGAALPAAEKTRLFLFHKPRGLVTSDHDPEGRPTVADFLREHWPEGPRVVTIGRLDINTEGLLLLTNDGGLARLLELPRTGWMRRYRVRAKGAADVATLDALADGVTIDGIDYAGIEAKLDRTQGANCWLTMGLREGKNREIKRVLEHIGLEVNRLIRLSFGPFQLLDLPEGAVEEVRTRVLRDQLGASLATQAGVAFDDAAAPAGERRHDREETPRRAAKPRDERRQTDADRSPRAPRSATASGTRRAGRRDDDRRDTRSDARDLPPPKRERPAAGTRKHVSTLRADDAETARRGPRKRIERSDAKVRGDRTVAVERLVSTRPAASAAPRGRPVRDDVASAERPKREGRPSRSRDNIDARSAARSGPPRERRDTGRHGGSRERDAHASPSALGKRERIARSGGRRPDGADEKPDREERRGRQDKPRQDRGRQDRGWQDRRDGVRNDNRPARARAPQDKRADTGRESAGDGQRGGSKGPATRGGGGKVAPRRPARHGAGGGPTGRASVKPAGPKPAGRKPPGGGGRPRGPSKPKR